MADEDMTNCDMIMTQWKKTRNNHHMSLQRCVLASAHMLQVISSSVNGNLLATWGGRARGSQSCSRGFSTWVADYLGDAPIYTLKQFRLRFRVPRALFYILRDALLQHNPGVWAQRVDCCHRRGQTTEVKILVCLRYLGTGRSLDDLDDSCRMSKETIRVYLRHFVTDMLAIYASMYVNRYPTRDELGMIAARYGAAGFPGCVGAVDCMNIPWKNCPLEEKGQYHNPKDGKLSVIKVEAWCDSDLYIWHWFVGPPGTVNDKIMVRFSPLFISIFNRSYNLRLPQPYQVIPGGIERTLGYFLGDGIYPHYPLFVLPIHGANTDRESLYTKRQEGRRKDIERAFGVIQARFKVLRREESRWIKKEILDTSRVCVVLHNMLVRMSQGDHFVEDMAAEGEDFNIISEMFDVDEEAAGVRGHEQLAQHQQMDAELAELNGEELLEELFLQEEEFTSEEMHDALQEDLIKRFAAEAAAARAARRN